MSLFNVEDMKSDLVRDVRTEGLMLGRLYTLFNASALNNREIGKPGNFKEVHFFLYPRLFNVKMRPGYYNTV